MGKTLNIDRRACDAIVIQATVQALSPPEGVLVIPEVKWSELIRRNDHISLLAVSLQVEELLGTTLPLHTVTHSATVGHAQDMVWEAIKQLVIPSGGEETIQAGRM